MKSTATLKSFATTAPANVIEHMRVRVKQLLPTPVTPTVSPFAGVIDARCTALRRRAPLKDRSMTVDER